MCDDYTCAVLSVLCRTYETDASLHRSTVPAATNILAHVATCAHEYCREIEIDRDADAYRETVPEIVHFALHEC